MSDVFELMSLLKGNDAYIYLDGDDRPWCEESSSPSLVFHAGGRRMTLGGGDERSISYLAASAQHFVDPSRFVMTWGVKDVFSFVRGRSGVAMDLASHIYDLGVMSAYMGVEAARPVKFRESTLLLKSLLTQEGWTDFRPLWEGVYVPLLSQVLPEIESCCLVDNDRRVCVYPFYSSDFQANGRLKASVRCPLNYNPHSMGSEQKSCLRPPGYDERFVHFDYRNMEVKTLQWLSGDERLGEVIDADGDPYRSIWSAVTRRPVSEDHRRICKDVFLPVVFGLGARSLAENIGVEEKFASKLIHTLVKTFPVAFDWVSSQSPDGDSMAKDRFGRRRRFKERDFYKIRNFSVQSPASMICLRKLVRLHEALGGLGRICFHVHDGYYVVCAVDKVDSVCEAGMAVLEEEDPLFPGLRLRASCYSGGRLDRMEPAKSGAAL
jgi:hypothetical protein